MQKISEIVRSARGKRSQTAFAKLLNKSQGLVSKYEQGIVNPPADVLETCLDILNMNNRVDIDIDILTKRIQKELRPPEFSYARKTIVAILDGLRSHA